MTEIDTTTMSEATRALLWVIGLLLSGGGCYLLGRKRTVTLDPNRVEAEPSRCELIRHDNEAKQTNLFARVAGLEQRVANLEGRLEIFMAMLTRIENKIDLLSHE